jgi:hypothetical protein
VEEPGALKGMFFGGSVDGWRFEVCVCLGIDNPITMHRSSDRPVYENPNHQLNIYNVLDEDLGIVGLVVEGRKSFFLRD